jgi:hypothetical protein
MTQIKEVTVGDSLAVKKPARLSPLGFFMALPPVLVILVFIGGTTTNMSYRKLKIHNTLVSRR